MPPAESSIVLLFLRHLDGNFDCTQSWIGADENCSAPHQQSKDLCTAEDLAGLFGSIWVALIVNSPVYIHANNVLL